MTVFKLVVFKLYLFVLRESFFMCHILLSIFSNFIECLDVIFVEYIYTFNLLSRAIVVSFCLNLFQLAITFCVCV